MFKYDVLDDDALNNSKKLAPGDANFKIIDATDEDKKKGGPLISKAGNQMMKVTLSIRDANGGNGILDDYFISDQSWKLHKLLKSVARSIWYKNGFLKPENLKNLTGQCILKDDSSPQYPNRVKVASYIDCEGMEASNDPRPRDPLDALDDIPF